MTDHCNAHDAPRAGHPIAQLADSLSLRISRLHYRRKLRGLMDMEDNILDDIGVTRSEVQTAINLPLSVDAATELRRMSLERRSRKF